MPRGGVDQVAGQRGVKDEPLRGEAVLQEDTGQILHIVGDNPDIPGKEGGKQGIPVPLVAGEEQLRQHRLPLPGPALDAHSGEIIQRQHRHVVRGPPSLQQDLSLRGICDLCHRNLTRLFVR